MKKILSISILLLIIFSISVSAITITQPSVLNLYNATYNAFITNGTIAGNCPFGFAVQNTTSTGVQCLNVSGTGGGSGTVTSIMFRNGFNQTTITVTGTVDLNYSAVQQRVNDTCAAGSSIRVINLDGSVVCENDSSGSGTVTQIDTGFGLSGGPITTTGTLIVNMSDIVSNIGNWSADRGSYATINYVLGLNNLSFLQIAGNIGNFSASYATMYANYTLANITLSGRVDSLNATKSGIGDCPAGQFVQNLTNGTPQCYTPVSSAPSDSQIMAVTAQPRNTIYKQFYDFESTTAGYTTIWIPAAIAGGSAGVSSGFENHIGVVNISTTIGQGVPGFAFSASAAASQNLLRNNSYFIVIANPLSKTGNYSISRFGYQDTFNDVNPADGFYVWMNTTDTYSNITLVAVNNTARTYGQMIQLNQTGQWLRFEGYVINNTLGVLYVYGSDNGTLLSTQTVTSNIPWQTGRETSSAVVTHSNGNTTAQRIMQFDYLEIGINQTFMR